MFDGLMPFVGESLLAACAFPDRIAWKKPAGQRFPGRCRTVKMFLLNAETAGLSATHRFAIG